MTHTTVALPKKKPAQNIKLIYRFLVTIFAVVAYAVAAYFLVYCLQHDEHFQIIEFASFKLGNTPAHSLPWEYEARLRSTIQPLMTCGLLSTFKLVGLRDPFHQTFALRLLSGILFVIAATRLRNALLPELQTDSGKFTYLFFSLFFYVLPMSGVRFSSENLSCCFFAIAFARTYFLLKKHGRIAPRKAFRIGVLFGLSFLLRYQCALLMVGFAVWLLVRRRKAMPDYAIMFVGFIAVFLLGILGDRWFYGEWVFTAFNYLNFNLLEGKSSGFGVSPWHYYLTVIDFTRWFGLLNASLTGFVILFLITRPKHPVTWIFLVFFITHSLIPHKETRFLYPILIFVPFMAVATFEYLHTQAHHVKKLLLIYLTCLGLINIAAFIATIFSPADNSTEIFKFIRTLPDKPIKIYHTSSTFMYTLNDGTKNITPNFYKDYHRISEQQLPPFSEITNLPSHPHPDTLTFIILYREAQQMLPAHIKPAFDPQPNFIHLLNYRNWMRHGENDWKLYQVEKQTNPNYSP